jgi:hypothetical protein
MHPDHGNWFSARVRLVSLVGEQRASHWMDCVHVFRANDWEAAFQRALELGRSHQEQYRNDSGTSVRWTLAEIVSLDMLGTDVLDGAEVYSEIREAEQSEGERVRIAPELSQPTQTL